MAGDVDVLVTAEAPVTEVRWARWWVWLWGSVAITLLVLLWVIPFKWWGLLAGIGFGTMEGIGLLRDDDAYPPLTHVIRRYVPRWLAFTLIYGILGGAGGHWFHLPNATGVGFLFGLLGWLTAHFDATFDGEAKRQERAKRANLKALAGSLTRRLGMGRSRG
jgi:hypothetical protein